MIVLEMANTKHGKYYEKFLDVCIFINKIVDVLIIASNLRLAKHNRQINQAKGKYSSCFFFWIQIDTQWFHKNALTD